MRARALGAATIMNGRLLACVVLALVALTVAQPGAAQSIEVREASLRRNCLDRGTADHPLVGKEFEACLRKQIEALPPLDMTKREHFGERYDPSKYVECRLKPGNRNNSACNVHILRRREWPEFWPENAVRPKWPEAPKISVYRKGMKPREYWEALCKAEAGEFIRSVVRDVESIYNARPRGVATDNELSDRFVFEDPFSHSDVLRSSKPEEYFIQPFLGRYKTYELRDSNGGSNLLRYFRSDKPTGPPYQTGMNGRWVRVPYIVAKTPVDSVVSRYSFTWRGISRPRDREHGIAGGELMIVDLTNGEVLGIRRGFALSGDVPNKAGGFWWPSAERCPSSNGHAPNIAFIRRVLQPLPDVNSATKPLEP